MLFRVGYTLTYWCPQPTPMILMLNVHASRVADIAVPDRLVVSPDTQTEFYHDMFGNQCMRILAPAGTMTLHAEGHVHDTADPDPAPFGAAQVPVEHLPQDTLVYLLGSRYCDTDLLSDVAWTIAEATEPGQPRVQAICDFTHNHIAFGYAHARPSKTAHDAYTEGRGVCRDYAHLAVALCRCVNIPARYCTGYISDLNMPPPYGPMDFAAWFEAYLDGGWHTFDARNNKPMYGRILMARGRDAADVAMVTSFGPNELRGFEVVCEAA